MVPLLVRPVAPGTVQPRRYIGISRLDMPGRTDHIAGSLSQVYPTRAPGVYPAGQSYAAERSLHTTTAFPFDLRTSCAKTSMNSCCVPRKHELLGIGVTAFVQIIGLYLLVVMGGLFASPEVTREIPALSAKIFWVVKRAWRKNGPVTRGFPARSPAYRGRGKRFRRSGGAPVPRYLG